MDSSHKNIHVFLHASSVYTGLVFIRCLK